MAVARMTQNMMSDRALYGMQTALGRLAKVQEQLSTGRVINRPSDDPTGATSAMRIRSSLSDQLQYARNADNAVGWLDQIDGTLSSVSKQLVRAREIATQGANDGAMGQESRDALATEVDQIAQGLVNAGNASYLGRPVFGGITAGRTAYAPDGTWTGVPGVVKRTVSDGVQVRVDVPGPDAFGPAGDSVWTHLGALATALRGGDTDGVRAALDDLGVDGERVIGVRADIGARTVRVEQAQRIVADAELSLSASLSELENTDLPKATVELQLQEVAYKAALAATARVMQPSLLDFLR